MTVKRRIAGGVAGVGAVVMAVSGQAVAAPASGGGWTETSTGQVSVMTVAQQGPFVTWAGGAAVSTDAQGVTRFTPTVYERDLEHGGTWRDVPLQGADAWDSRINDMALPADGSGFFVGDQGTGDQGVLVGRYTAGSWRLTADTSLPAGTVDASLLSVSAASGQDAWAVGQGYEQDTWTMIPLVQHWDGRRWRSVRIPGSADWGLYQVQELSPDDVWVVGADYGTGQSLALHWNGHTWTRTPTPAFPDSSVLFDVVARTPSDVWAVGWSRDTDKQRPAGLALHWDGTAWKEVPLPAGTFALQAAALRPHGGLAVVGGNDDAAVGLAWAPGTGWQSLGLPENDPSLPLGVASITASGSHLTIGGWHYVSADTGDTFSSGALLTR
ncbi:hypothetical protein [Streptomyces sp. HPF1205]|uniref:hypothetical protein n=1 Tax=Streptomyces sp. HPF1205 TaxID=2873262 RepID=UPI001CEC9261|nr:hypothetical protein [Streptomyces sp. HPF1205]